MVDRHPPMVDGQMVCHGYMGVHIPGCWPCVLHPDLTRAEHQDLCLCPRPERSRDALILRMEALEAKVALLTAAGSSASEAEA